MDRSIALDRGEKEKIIEIKHAIQLTRMNSLVLLKCLTFSYNGIFKQRSDQISYK